MITSLQKSLTSTFRDIEVTLSGEGRMSVFAPAESIPIILRYLKEHGLDRLALLSCVDWIEEGQFEIVYFLTPYRRDDTDDTTAQGFHVFLKARVSREAPSVKSVIDVFENAEPYEREIHELFGVHFDGHPRLIPLFLERHYEIPPFRKDFDTRRYVEDTFGAIAPVED